MRRKQIVTMAWENLKLRKLRTSLTTLGVVIGITAVIALASLGEGFRVAVTDRMQQGFELDVLTVIPGSLFAGLSRERFTDQNVRNIKNIAGVVLAASAMQIGNVTLYNGNKKVKAFVATAVNFTEFVEVFPDRFIFETGGVPESGKNDSIVIGYKVNYPNETEPAFAEAGDNITMGLTVPTKNPYRPYEVENRTFTVAGTLQKKGSPGITNFDYWVFIPMDVARKIYGTNESDLIFAKVSDPNSSEKTASDIEALFPPYQVSILVPLTFIQQVNSIINLIQLFLTSIASVSLLVAGIGIMNIMTVSVMERTHEIGIMKAIGAENRTILTIFLTETFLIGILGGLIGVPSGYGLSYLLSYVTSNYLGSRQQGAIIQNPAARTMMISPIFSLWWAAGAVIFGIGVSIVFGLYPARKAANLNPVEALRYE
jgi:putative ABC transport system permease protein